MLQRHTLPPQRAAAVALRLVSAAALLNDRYGGVHALKRLTPICGSERRSKRISRRHESVFEIGDGANTTGPSRERGRREQEGADFETRWRCFDEDGECGAQLLPSRAAHVSHQWRYKTLYFSRTLPNIVGLRLHSHPRFSSDVASGRHTLTEEVSILFGQIRKHSSDWNFYAAKNSVCTSIIASY